jgi:hypothetical protein
MERRFYDLGRINYWGQKKVDWGFDDSKVLSKDELIRQRQEGEAREIQRVHGKRRRPAQNEILACGGGGQLPGEGEATDRVMLPVLNTAELAAIRPVRPSRAAAEPTVPASAGD